MRPDWLGYSPARVAALARLTGEAIDFLDETRSNDPVTQPTMVAIRAISHSLSTTWMPLFARLTADTSLLTWSSRAPGPLGWTAAQITGVAAVLVPPVVGGPAAVAAWWAGLSDQQRAELTDEHPQLVGNTNGLPAAVRDAANRAQMAADLDALELREQSGTITAADAQVLANIRRAREALIRNDDTADPITGDAVGGQLYIYEPAAFGGDGRIAIAFGDLDTAEHVAVIVPGLGSDASTIGSGQAHVIHLEARAASGDSVAVLSWIGYDAPTYSTTNGSASDGFDEAIDVAGVVNQEAAQAGAEILAADVAGLNAMRGNGAHVTVIGNSYGSTVAAIAADEDDLAADDLVLTGSPGAGDADTAADLTTGNEHTWVGSASSDLVSYLGEQPGWEPQDTLADLLPGVEPLGDDPSAESFGARRFQAESVRRRGGGAPGNTDDHGYYFEADSESLFNIGAIVGGEYDLVLEAEHRDQQPFFEAELDLDWTPFGDFHPFADDPEADRTPTAMTHER